MRFKTIASASALSLCALSSVFSAQTQGAPTAREAQAKITRLDLFRDATVAVYRQLDAGKAGETLRIPMEDAILFSSFSYDPSLVGSVSRARWLGEAPADYYQNAVRPYLGKLVEIKVAEGGSVLVYEGTLAAPKDWNNLGNLSIVCLLTERGPVTFPLASVRGIIAKDGKLPKTEQVEKYGLTFALSKDGAPAISYVSEGIGWAPYCEIHLVSEDKIRFRQYAEILNEFGDFEGVPISLVSGDARAAFQKKISLLSPNQTWRSFLGGGQIRITGSLSLAAMPASADASFGNVESAGSGTDFSFKQVGIWSLKKNDALNIPLIDGMVGSRRLVKWEVSDAGEWQGVFRAKTADNPAYDSVIFTNPFEEPLVDSPVAIYSEGRVLSQANLPWVNPRGEATVRIATAPGLEADFEDVLAASSAQNELVTIGGNTYQKATMQGTLTAKNLRDTPMHVEIARTVIGIFGSAQGDPTVTAQPQMYTANNSVKLTWRFTLQPNESKTFTYTYDKLRNN